MLDDVSDRRREPHIEFCGQQVFEWSDIPSAVSTIDWSPTNTASMILRQLCTKDGQLPILTVAVGSSIFFYGVDQPDDEYATVSLKELYTLETGIRGTIYQIRGVSNLLALASLSSDGSKHELSFWAEMRTMEPPALFTSVIFEDRIRDMAWSMSSDAQFLLAVAFSSHIAIYGENRRSDINHDEPTWTCYTIFEVDSPADIVGVTWADYGVLAVAAGNQIRCYLKWLTVNDNIKGSLRLNPEAEPMSNIYDLSYEKNGPLPLYHPYHLIHYLMWGKMELITHVLYSLYKFVRQTIDEENVTEQVPPLSVSAILKLQNVQSQQQPHQDSSALFDDDDTRLDLDDLGHDSPRALTSSESTFLMKHLKQKRLAGLSEREQMHLVAMIDTFVEITAHNEALDENGARFTALVENHFHLNQILPADQRQPDLTSRDIVWALHSQSQDMLLERCMKLGGKNLMWPDARSLGLVLWLQKIDVVRDLIATIARNTYLAKEELKDPVDCTLFYLALRKKNLLQGLWRTASHHKEQSVMLKFLANDFSEPRWQKAAVKNAFVLLGRQRFEYAASFFLLADRLRDAVNVILKHMKDSQLAIAICRVYEGDHSPLLKDILQNTVLSDAIAANDRWMVSAAFWMLNRPSDAVRAIVLPLSQFDESVDTHDQASVATITDPNLFILYQHMKIHVQHRNHVTVDIPYDVEYMFYLQVSRAYERLGCPLLALYILDHFYMKPPLAVKASPPITEEKPSRAADLSADENDEPSRAANKKPARAVDLFADEDPKPARAADLFADDDVKPARAADLFGDSDDDSNNLFSRSRSTGPVDLFADLETTTPIPTYDDDDLFADSDLGSQAASSASDEAPMEKTKDGLSSYKALLLMRMLQTVFHAAATLYHTIPMAEIHQEPKFQDAFLTDRQDLIELGETLAIDRTMFSRLLMEKTIEVDVFPFYMNILDQHVLDGGDVGYFLQAFKTSYFQICEPVLMQRELTDVLATFHIWSRLMTQHDTSPKTALIVNNIVLSSYVCSIVTTLQQRHYEKSWKLLYHLRELIEAVLGGANKQHEMVRLFTKLQTQETPMVEMNAEDFDAFSDDSMFGFDLNEEIYKPLVDARDKSSGAYIMEAASLNHTLSLLESCMKTSAKATGINSKALSRFCCMGAHCFVGQMNWSNTSGQACWIRWRPVSILLNHF
ncbi:RAVE protein 1 C terminal-domain-containing protein [Radiomyces spectabilis]|uniref:RAVE protein 1 C terminal-domain-containing protein n=1 Tax=Radiomyces spectabilis TaxID=64574 RepID=UPI002220A965|nr:RAVE protein 1 C terminal-domain-containing protein [Radiomyces spectabilis]KAI8369422.1 RAVE protein 1 C terminal-domain-containing protein [Radiomyces spectabilis]